MEEVPGISGEATAFEKVEEEIAKTKSPAAKKRGRPKKEDAPKPLTKPVQQKTKDKGMLDKVSDWFETLKAPDPKDVKVAEKARWIHDEMNPTLAALGYKFIIANENIGVATYISPEQAQAIAMGLGVFEGAGVGSIERILTKYIMPLYLIGAAGFTVASVGGNLWKLKAAAASNPDEVHAWLNNIAAQQPNKQQVVTQPAQEQAQYDIESWINQAVEQPTEEDATSDQDGVSQDRNPSDSEEVSPTPQSAKDA